MIAMDVWVWNWILYFHGMLLIFSPRSCLLVFGMSHIVSPVRLSIGAVCVRLCSVRNGTLWVEE